MRLIDKIKEKLHFNENEILETKIRKCLKLSSKWIDKKPEYGLRALKLAINFYEQLPKGNKKEDLSLYIDSIKYSYSNKKTT